MIPLLVLSLGCTYYFGDTACDSATVQLETDSLTRSSTSDWAAPAVGDRFVCAIESPPADFPTTPASMDAVRCFGDAPATPDELSTFVRGITKLSAGGGLLCASSPGDPQDGVLAAVQCWGPGADAVNLQAAEDIEEHPGMVVETLEAADQQACVLSDVNQDGIRNARCYGTGPVVDNLDLTLLANFEGLSMSNEMACKRYQEGPDIVFKCWGDMEADVRDTLGQLAPNGCWSTFDSTDGLLCANSGPSDECPPVDCWGDRDHPVMAGLADIADDLVGISSVPGARPTAVHLGVDFACVSYGNSEVLCFGNETPSITDHPTGTGFINLTTSPSGSLACALQPGTDPPVDGADPTGTMVCWGEADGVTIELP